MAQILNGLLFYSFQNSHLNRGLYSKALPRKPYDIIFAQRPNVSEEGQPMPIECLLINVEFNAWIVPNIADRWRYIYKNNIVHVAACHRGSSSSIGDI